MWRRSDAPSGRDIDKLSFNLINCSCKIPGCDTPAYCCAVLIEESQTGGAERRTEERARVRRNQYAGLEGNETGASYGTGCGEELGSAGTLV